MKKSIRLWAEDDRPREKLLLKGSHSLSNAELIAILLGSGTRDLSALDVSRLLLDSHSDDLSVLARSKPDKLKKIPGIGEAKAVAICAAMELARRKEYNTNRKQIKIRSSKDAFEAIHYHFLDKGHEEFYIILLNRANEVIAVDMISQGGLSGTVADGKVIFKKALDKSASAMILCHNHPSGQLKPSDADRRLTSSLIQFGKCIDLQILDHLIVAQNNYFSFADEGIMH